MQEERIMTMYKHKHLLPHGCTEKQEHEVIWLTEVISPVLEQKQVDYIAGARGNLLKFTHNT